jgi:hypothetical protein
MSPQPEEKVTKAPRPLVQTLASKTTQSLTGVYQWKLFKGKRDYILTGYDKKSRAVQGISFRFSPGTSKAKPNLEITMLDGSKTTSRTDYFHKARTKGKISNKARMFLHRALSDLKTTRKKLGGIKGHNPIALCGVKTLEIGAGAAACHHRERRRYGPRK